MSTEERSSIQRREFLRKAAVTGAAAAWAAPLVQTVAATPAFAHGTGTPSPCHHSIGGISGGGCMQACQQSGPGGEGGGCGAACNDQCSPLCPVGTPDRHCACEQACDPAYWENCVFRGCP